MPTLNHAEAVRNITRVSQILVGAMVGGQLVFLAIVLMIARGNPPADWNGPMGPPLLTTVAFLLGAVGLVLSFIVPSLIVAGVLKRLAQRGPEDLTVQDLWREGSALPPTDVGALLQIFQSQIIFGAALLEALALLGLIAYMQDGGAPPLGIVAIMIVAMLLRFPTVDRVNVWLDEQLARLARLRSDGV